MTTLYLFLLYVVGNFTYGVAVFHLLGLEASHADRPEGQKEASE